LHQSNSKVDNRLFTDQIIINYSKEIFDSTAKMTFQKIENDVSGIYIQEKEISLFSAKYSKSRIYYTIWEEAIYVSYDLRLLLPYSNRKLTSKAAFSIIKFGELPESVNLIHDIYSVPSSSYVTLDNDNFYQILANKVIESSYYSIYNFIEYNYSGGDINKTKQALGDSLKYFINCNPNFFVSGGIDSTLLIQLYYELTGNEIKMAILLILKKHPMNIVM